MNPTALDPGIAYRFAIDHQATLRDEIAIEKAAHSIDRRSGEPLPPTRGPLAALRRRFAGTPSFA